MSRPSHRPRVQSQWGSAELGEQSRTKRTPDPSSTAPHSSHPLDDVPAELIDLAKRLGVPFLRLSADIPSVDLAWRLPAEEWEKCRCVPVAQEGNTLTVATVNPQNRQAIQQLADRVGCNIYPVLSSPEDVRMALDRLHAFQRLSNLQQARLHRAEFKVKVIVGGLRYVRDLLVVEAWLESWFGAECIALPKGRDDYLLMVVPAEACDLLTSMLDQGIPKGLGLKRSSPDSLELEYRHA